MSYLPRAIGVLSTIIGIDAKTVGVTDLFIVPTNFNAVITGAVIYVTAVSGLITVATGGIGINVTQDDIFAAVAFTGLDAVTKVFMLHSLGIVTLISAGTTIKFGIDIGATGTTQTVRIDLLGYLTT